ncbi:ABC transporter ATP-binding protein [Brenneria corticis]|nr:ABC transporter ATP-binding protein [Brenneria sp. CFCC 11842]
MALRDVTITVGRNEIVCLVGESGSGKSIIASSIMGLLPTGVRVVAGSVKLGRCDLLQLNSRQLRDVRGKKIGLIFQEPMTALNPLKRIGDQIAEMFLLHTDLSGNDIHQRVIDNLVAVGIPDPVLSYKAYPHQLSGGQRQRVMIAMAMALDPDLLIADEPTTALDVTTQKQILELIRKLQQRNGTGVLFITHDFGVVADIADRVVVLQQGRVVEDGRAADVLGNPQHPYTQSLIAAVPRLEPRPPRLIASENVVMQVTDMSKTYGRKGIFGKGRVVHALCGVSFELKAGHILGIVGESGSGKSTLAQTIVRLVEPDSGKTLIDDIDYTALSAKELRRHRGLVQMVFQDPFSALNPRRKVKDLISQPMTVHGVSSEEAYHRARELVELVGLDDKALNRFPHEFSGGQRQRIGIARALALEPKILVADEAVSALDVSIQAKVLALLEQLREKLGLSIVFITHDLRVTAQICDEIIVMKDGKIIEYGDTARIFANPQDNYTRLLLASVPGYTGRTAIED